MNIYDFIPGVVQGVVRASISFPFEVVKIDMQLNKNNIFYTFNNIIKNDPKKFYRGIQIPLLATGLERGFQFSIYENTKKNNSILVNSFLTSFISNTIFAPLSILTVRIIASKKDNYTSLINFIKKSKKEKNLSKGISLEITKNYLSTFTYFYIYSTLQKNTDINNYYLKTFISGVLSSVGVWTIVLPFDTIKVNYQVSEKSLLKIIKNINSRNLLSLWSGFTPVVLKTIPSAGFGMIAYEYTKKKIKE
jgi:hypothetical protein